MKTYIGTKQVKAEPMNELAAVEERLRSQERGQPRMA